MTQDALWDMKLFHATTAGAKVPQKTVEYFAGRDDRLVFRSATYDTPPPGSVRVEDLRILPKKMRQKFSRNMGIAAHEDVECRTFYKPSQSDGSIRLQFHYAADSITRPSRLFSKGHPVTLDKADPFARDPKPAELAEEMRRLFLNEKECLAEIKEADKEAREVLQQREKEEAHVQSIHSVYDVLREVATESEEEQQKRQLEERQREQLRKDYLAGYIAQVRNLRGGVGGMNAASLKEIKLTKEEAEKVKTLALKELKDRLIQRAQIMQGRLDEEKEKLQKRQSAFVKNQDQVDNPKEHEEYTKYCEEAMWRIHILEKRLDRHQEQSFARYAELDLKLRHDPRLARWLTSGGGGINDDLP